jgi:1,4-dihydroxy-6-naphthoate synthase
MPFSAKNTNSNNIRIQVAHSPDADDRFMFWPLKQKKIDPGPFLFEWHEADTQTLNQWASGQGIRKSPDVCAISVAHYPNVAPLYQPLKMGCSVGSGYGPVLVVGPKTKVLWREQKAVFEEAEKKPNASDGKEILSLLELKPILLTPGHQTTAHAVCRVLGFGGLESQAVSISPIELVFEKIHTLENEGRPVVAILIHEGRLVFQKFHCEKVLDLGEAWHQRTQGPLPLGMNVISRSLSLEVRQQLSCLFVESCQWALEHKHEYLEEAQKPDSPYYTPLSTPELAHYLELYANQSTCSVLPQDAQSFDVLFREAFATPVPCDWI